MVNVEWSKEAEDANKRTQLKLHKRESRLYGEVSIQIFKKGRNPVTLDNDGIREKEIES